MPPTLSFKEMRPPQFDEDFYRPFLLGAMNDWSQDVIKEFDKTTEFWKKDRPVFTRSLSTIADKRSKIEVQVSTDNVIYNNLDIGVKGHTIKMGWLGEKSGKKGIKAGTEGTYKSQSLPGTLSVSKGGKATKSGFYLNLHWDIPWPGIKARDFSSQILRKLERSARTSLSYRLQLALDKAATKAFKEKGV